MKTKEEELKILAKIEKLIQEAGGEESYIGMAFEGVCEDARDNIKWDMGCSYLQRYNHTLQQLEDRETELIDQVEAKEREILKLQKELDLANRNLEIVKGNEAAKDETLNEALEQIKEMGANLAEAKAGEEWEKARADQAGLELLKLKAKLYDKMMEEGE